MLQQIIELSVTSYGHELAWRLLDDIQECTSSDEANLKLRHLLHDAETNMLADLDVRLLCERGPTTSRRRHTVRLIPSLEHVFPRVDRKRKNRDIDEHVSARIKTVYDAHSEYFTLCEDAIVFSQINSEPIDSKNRRTAVEQLLSPLETMPTFSSLVATARDCLVVKVHADPRVDELQHWSGYDPRSKQQYWIARILRELCRSRIPFRHFISDDVWSKARNMVDYSLRADDLRFLHLAQIPLLYPLLISASYTEILRDHVIHVVREEAEKIIPPATTRTDSSPSADVVSQVLTRSEFGERLFDLFHQHGDVGASTKLSLIELCTKRSGRLKLKSPYNYKAAVIANVVAHKLGIDEGEIKLDNKGNVVDMEQRSRALKRIDDRKEDPVMQQLITELKALNVAAT